jgi:hypothetical protein
MKIYIFIPVLLLVHLAGSHALRRSIGLSEINNRVPSAFLTATAVTFCAVIFFRFEFAAGFQRDIACLIAALLCHLPLIFKKTNFNFGIRALGIVIVCIALRVLFPELWS